MRFLIFNEKGYKNKEGEKIVLEMSAEMIEIPDNILTEFKTAYELWLKEQKEKSNNGIKNR